MLDDMCHFMKLGCSYPGSWDAMSTDLEYYEDKIPFEKVTCPVHMIHGDCDNDIEYNQSVQAHAGIPGSVFVTIEKGTHSLQFHESWKEANRQQFEFGKKACGMPYDEELVNKKL